ncbi:MAG: tetratricopeptide repeat protein [Candidatus Nitrotoga sp.]
MQTLYLNSISKLFITAVLGMALLSGCGGGGSSTTPPSADQVAYNAALANYNAAGAAPDPVAAYNAAIAEFTTFKNAYPLSTRVDDAGFYIARATHELALIDLAQPTPAGSPTLAQARIIYAELINTTSNRADDAQYQIGRTYYDVANYSQALIEFERVFDTNKYPAPSAGDDARYYIGRTKHEQAVLAEAVTSGTGAALFTAARTEYNQVLTTYCPLSIRCDDAQYQIGRTYFDVAAPITTDYSTALGHFQAVIDTYGTTASVADDARYYLGRSKHEIALLPAIPPAVPAYTLNDARAEYTLVLSNYCTAGVPLSTRCDDARYQVGRTYFDDPTPTVPNYQLAINEFQNVLDSYCATVIASACDNAQYFKARSIHERALLTTPTIDAAGLESARTEYGVVLASYLLSSRRDDAQYQIGKTYFDVGNDAQAITEFNKVLDIVLFTAPSVGDDAQYYKARAMHNLANSIVLYDNARIEYAKVNVTAYPLSDRIDDAEFYSALTYHDSTQCAFEKTAMQAFVTKYFTSTVPGTVIFVADANVHITDLNISPSSNSQRHKACIP